MHEHADNLIPDLSRWNDGHGIDLLSWIGCVGREDHAIAYAALFWPDFTVHDDCVFLDPPNVDNFNAWMAQCKGDRTAVESVTNHRHIVTLFGDSDFDVTKDVVVHLGRLLKDMWSCKLTRDFPDRRMTVEFSEADTDDLLDYEITVYQQRAST
jgi:hypothetical protein